MCGVWGWGVGGVEGRKRVARPRTRPGRPRRPWTAAGTTIMLRQCPLAIAQQLVHYAIAVSTAVQSRSSHKDNVRSTAVEPATTEAEDKSNFLSPAPPPGS